MGGQIPVGGAIASAFFLVVGAIGIMEGERPMGVGMLIVGAVGLALSITALAMAAGQRGDPRSRMRRLERLKAEGLVSGEEYEAKRAEILENL